MLQLVMFAAVLLLCHCSRRHTAPEIGKLFDGLQHALSYLISFDLQYQEWQDFEAAHCEVGS